MRSVVLVLLLGACSEKKPDAPPPPVAKPAGPPPSCVEYEKLLAHLETCADQEQSSYVDILMAKSSLRMNRDSAQLAAYCTENTRHFRAAFPRCVTAEARGSAPPPPIESIALEPSVLGTTPGPFGRLAFLRAGITRDEILDELAIPSTRSASIPVELGITGLEARIDIDFANTLDVIKIRVPPALRDMLTQAWGPPARGYTWFDTTKRWRADLSTELMIGPYVPFDSLLGDGPDGLPDITPLIGLTSSELAIKFGARWNGREILMPATDVCAYYTKLFVDFDGGRASQLRLQQCFDDGERRAVLDAMTRHWGKPTPIKRPGKPDLLTFSRPGRSFEVSLDARIVVTIAPTAER